MKYMLLICAGGPVDPSAAAGKPPTIEEWLEEVGSRRLHGSQMRPVSDATTVRTRGDEVLISDGPFADTKEHIAGYDLIECADLDEAVQIASRHPVAYFGSVEVRPMMED
ncbi:MAG TPA: YciI family protein [Pseudonocardiaceae bacterium]|nr:YciI family protein [Pseudonocardiaceae bacterium]